jgi:hypothetical protein
MSAELRADTSGMTVGAAESAMIASSLAAVEDEAMPGFQPSHAGVSAVSRAIHIVRNRQAGRVLGQAGAMRAGATAYEDTDAQSAEGLAESV